MNKKKIYIISIVVIVVIALALVGFYYYKNVNKPLTEQDKINILDQLSKESKSNYNNQQKAIILNNLSSSSKDSNVSKLTKEQKLQLMQSAAQ